MHHDGHRCRRVTVPRPPNDMKRSSFRCPSVYKVKKTTSKSRKRLLSSNVDIRWKAHARHLCDFFSRESTAQANSKFSYVCYRDVPLLWILHWNWWGIVLGSLEEALIRARAGCKEVRAILTSASFMPQLPGPFISMTWCIPKEAETNRVYIMLKSYCVLFLRESKPSLCQIRKVLHCADHEQGWISSFHPIHFQL